MLQPFYTGANLNDWRFGYGSRQPANNATTDCSVTYFNNESFVNRLSVGRLSTDLDFHWLFHEMQHFVQCSQLRDRDAYALMWFGQLGVTFIQNNDLATLHDRMPMEADADSIANNVLGASDPFRDEEGFLSVRPSINILYNNQIVTSTLSFLRNVPFTITANGSGGGNTPLRFSWSIKKPEHNNFLNIRGSGAGGCMLHFTPQLLGDYQLKGIARVSGTPLNAEKTINFRVVTNRNEPPNPVNRPKDLYFRGEFSEHSNKQTLAININRLGGAPFPEINVCVQNPLNHKLYWQAIIYSSKAIFLVPSGKAVKVTLSKNGYKGISQVVHIPENEAKTITVGIAHGTGGPVCYGIQ